MITEFKVRGDDITWTQSGSEIVILELGESNYFSLNEAGSLLWPALLKGETIETLSTILSAHYDIPLEAATLDVQDLVSGLQSRRIVLATEHEAASFTVHPGNEVHVRDQSA